jgi:hypothetical protein
MDGRLTFNQQENDMAHTFKTTAKVWISGYSPHDAESLQLATDICGMTLSEPDMNLGLSPNAFTHVGEADVTITIANSDQIIGGKVASLRAQLESDRADSQRRQNELIDKINKLEALTYEPAAV